MARPPKLVAARSLPHVDPPEPVRDPSIVASYLDDASALFPGEAPGVVRPDTEAAAASFLAHTSGRGIAVLPQAARSSLTGGAIPSGEIVVSVERLTEIGPVEQVAGEARVRAGAGVRLTELERHLAERGYYYPPVPTYREAMLGGTVSTNAGGGATFRYGVTRQWVRSLRVLLANGDLLELERGVVTAPRGGTFRIALSDGNELSVPAPGHRLPDLKKISAGYFASDPLDLVDLFVGSEGTLGLITSVEVAVIPSPEGVLVGLLFLSGLPDALAMAGEMRSVASASDGPAIRAIEIIDAHGLALLRRGGDARRLRVEIPDDARACLIFEAELSATTADEALRDRALGEIVRRAEAGPGLDNLHLGFPDDPRRREQILGFREALPVRVNEILAARRRDDPAVHKTGGDLIVPFPALGEMVRLVRDVFEGAGLEHALWGHVSDGNLHPNALARDAEEVKRAEDALLLLGERATSLGGCPLSEHGVGRSPLKQEMLRRFLGAEAVETMRSVKRALDPEWRFAPGVLFAP